MTANLLYNINKEYNIWEKQINADIILIQSQGSEGEDQDQDQERCMIPTIY